MHSPVGPIEIRAEDDFITAVLFKDNEGESHAEPTPALLQCRQELQEYFAGTRRNFSVLIKLNGNTFQMEVWKRLLDIAYGDTMAYGEIAKAAGDANASRAVGTAAGKNPIAIIVPCHRVIGANGKLTGYAGGPWRKNWLLQHEGNISGKNLTLF